MRYPVKGRHPDTDAPVQVDLGWTDGVGYWLGVDDEDGKEITAAVNLSLPELVDRSRAYVRWDRKLFANLERAPADQYAEDHPGDPVSEIIAAAR